MNLQEKRTVLTQLSFSGKGGRYLGIIVINFILTIITFGLYYPWAKTAVRKYIWNETMLDNDRFMFHGTGKELFKGYLIAYAFLGTLSLLLLLDIINILALFSAIIVILPFVIYSGWKYRVSRTSWRGIYFSFNGQLSKLLRIYFTTLSFCLISLSLFAYVFYSNTISVLSSPLNMLLFGSLLMFNVIIAIAGVRVEILRYLISHTQLGTYKFGFTGKQNEYIKISVLGMLFSMLTLGIYSSWYFANKYNFILGNITIDDGENVYPLKASVKGLEFFLLSLVYSVVIPFTLGFGFSWMVMDIQRLLTNSILIPAELDLDKIGQQADNYKNAAGDELFDILDIGIGV